MQWHTSFHEKPICWTANKVQRTWFLQLNTLWRKVFTANCFLFCQLAPARIHSEKTLAREVFAVTFFLLWSGKRLLKFPIALFLRMSRCNNRITILQRKYILVEKKQFTCVLPFLYVNKLNCYTFWGYESFYFLLLFLFCFNTPVSYECFVFLCWYHTCVTTLSSKTVNESLPWCGFFYLGLFKKVLTIHLW